MDQALYIQYQSILSSSTCIDSLNRAILTLVKSMGFSDFIFLRTDRHWQKHSRQGLLYSVPDELIRIYHDEKLYENDLLMYYAKNNTRPLLTSVIYEYVNSAPYETELFKINRKIQQLNRRFSIVDYYTITTKAYNKQGNVLLMVTNQHISTDAFRSQARKQHVQISTLCKALDAAYTQQFNEYIKYCANPSRITARQLEVFSLLANHDVAITEISRHMNIKPITAHQHIAAAKKTLKVNTNIAAIKKLLQLECIHYD